MLKLIQKLFRNFIIGPVIAFIILGSFISFPAYAKTQLPPGGEGFPCEALVKQAEGRKEEYIASWKDLFLAKNKDITEDYFTKHIQVTSTGPFCTARNHVILLRMSYTVTVDWVKISLSNDFHVAVSCDYDKILAHVTDHVVSPIDNEDRAFINDRLNGLCGKTLSKQDVLRLEEEFRRLKEYRISHKISTEENEFIEFAMDRIKPYEHWAFASETEMDKVIKNAITPQGLGIIETLWNALQGKSVETKVKKRFFYNKCRDCMLPTSSYEIGEPLVELRFEDSLPDYFYRSVCPSGGKAMGFVSLVTGNISFPCYTYNANSIHESGF